MHSCGPREYVATLLVVALLLSICRSSQGRLVRQSPLILSYHNGPLLTSSSAVYTNIVWYGNFSDNQKSAVQDFLASFDMESDGEPSVTSWWDVMRQYKDSKGQSATHSLKIGAEISDSGYSIGRSLTLADIEFLVTSSHNNNGHELAYTGEVVYLILTQEDVMVQGFCMNSCAKHSVIAPSKATLARQIPYAWVGNSASQCAGRCAWPFAKPEYGPDNSVLIPPNGDAGVDGMIINLASILAGTVTNPYSTGFFQGNGAAPLEAATACAGTYGARAFPGYPGELAVDQITGASFNSRGVNDRKFLLPALWDPSTLSCTVQTLSSTGI